MPAANVVWGIHYDGSGGSAAVQDMFLSTDGGASWTSNTIFTTNSATAAMCNISAVDGATAYVSAYDDVTGGGGYIFKTTDGGNNWSELTLPTLSFLNFVHMFNAQDGVLMSDPDSRFQIYTTADGGTTWTRVPPANVPMHQANDFGLVNQFDALGDNIWFTTLKGDIYHSTDKGMSWMKQATGFTASGQNAAIRQVEFSDANNGLVVGRAVNTLRRTTNGGMTWTNVPLTAASDFFGSGLARIPNLPGAYVSTGANPTEALGTSVSYDYGLTWTELDTAEQRTAVIFFDNQNGWAGSFTQAGGLGGLLKYTGSPLATRRDIVRENGAAYPNPTTGLLRLAGTDPRETVTVYDRAGRVVLRQAVGAAATLDLSSQPVGLYQLVFTGGKVSRTTRVAVTR